MLAAPSQVFTKIYLHVDGPDVPQTAFPKTLFKEMQSEYLCYWIDGFDLAFT